MRTITATEALGWLDDRTRYLSDASAGIELALLSPDDLRAKQIPVPAAFLSDNEIAIPRKFLDQPMNFLLRTSLKSVSNSRIVILAPYVSTEIIIEANAALIFIGSMRFGRVVIRAFKNSMVVIGCGTSANHALLTTCDSSILIGKECMISDDVMIQSSDQHSIVDIETSQVINPGHRSLVIEDYVWVGRRAIITGGVTIGRGSVVGIGSLVNKDVPRTVVVAGSPARVVRENATWSRMPGEIDKTAEQFLKSLAE